LGQAKTHYLDLISQLGGSKDADLVLAGKHQCVISAATETTALAMVALTKEKDKGKLRALMQSVVKHIRDVQSTYVDPTDKISQPTSILHEALKKRIAAALKLR
jgi:hypothetical protein